MSPNVVGGSPSNTVAAGVHGAVIAGGAEVGGPHEVHAHYATVSGGAQNTLEGSWYANIAGGQMGRIQSNAWWSAISGGEMNRIGTNANWAAVPWGRFNVAGGNASLAAGYGAQALHPGAFVWADFQETTVTSTAPNQFLIRASGGVGIGTNNPRIALHVEGTVTAQVIRLSVRQEVSPWVRFRISFQ